MAERYGYGSGLFGIEVDERLVNIPSETFRMFSKEVETTVYVAVHNVWVAIVAFDMVRVVRYEAIVLATNDKCD